MTSARADKNTVLRAALSRWLPLTLFFCAGIVFFRTMVVHGGGDLRVYWRVAHRVLQGGPIYVPSADIPMGFKYPPWILPIFLPLGALSFETARMIWAGVSVVAMYASFYWIVRKLGGSLGAMALALAITWGIWGGQFNHGQINVVVLCGLLWCWHPKLPKSSLGRSVGLIYVSTTKIISVFPLLFFLTREGPIRLRSHVRRWMPALAVCAGVFLVLSIPALHGYSAPRVPNLVRNWSTVASSAVRGFGPRFARGRMNQGLPVVLGRITNFDSLSSLPEEVGFVLVSLVLALWWSRASRLLTDAESWAGWVAWICVVGPLSWSHNFVLALPLLTATLDRAWHSRNRRWIALALLGIFFVGPLTFNLGRGLGGLFGHPDALVPITNFIEHMSIKSIGLLLCAAVLVRAAAAERASSVDAAAAFAPELPA